MVLLASNDLIPCHNITMYRVAQ